MKGDKDTRTPNHAKRQRSSLWKGHTAKTTCSQCNPLNQCVDCWDKDQKKRRKIYK